MPPERQRGLIRPRAAGFAASQCASRHRDEQYRRHDREPGGSGRPHTAIGTGLRQGELLALRWSDLDLEAGTITVNHTLERRTRRLTEPKTSRARRTVTIANEVCDALVAHRRRQKVARIDGLVFASSAGTPLDSRNVTHAFQAALRRAGLPHQRFHDLRHCYATLLIEAGEDLGVVSRMLGHADFSTTSDVYAHLTRAMQGRAAERMDTILKRTAAR